MTAATIGYCKISVWRYGDDAHVPLPDHITAPDFGGGLRAQFDLSVLSWVLPFTRQTFGSVWRDAQKLAGTLERSGIPSQYVSILAGDPDW